MSAVDSTPPPSTGLDSVAKYSSDDEKKASRKRDDSRSRSRSMDKDKKKERSRRRSRSSSASGDEKKRKRSRSSSRSTYEKSSRRRRSRSGGRRSRSRTYSPNRRSSGSAVTRIHVSGFDGAVSRHDLNKAFSEFGELTDIWLTSRQPHYAFITFSDSRDAEDAMKTLNDTTLCGSRIRIAHALPRRIGSGGGRFGGGGGGGGGRRDYGGGGGYRDSRDSFRRRSRSRSRSPPRRNRNRRSSSRSRSRS